MPELLRKAKDGIAVVDDLIAMGDEDHGMAMEFLGQTFKEESLGLGVEGRAELIEKQDGAGTEKGSGDGDALSLTFGETSSGFETLGVEA